MLFDELEPEEPLFDELEEPDEPEDPEDPDEPEEPLEPEDEPEEPPPRPPPPPPPPPPGAITTGGSISTLSTSRASMWGCVSINCRSSASASAGTSSGLRTSIGPATASAIIIEMRVNRGNMVVYVCVFVRVCVSAAIKLDVGGCRGRDKIRPLRLSKMSSVTLIRTMGGLFG